MQIYKKGKSVSFTIENALIPVDRGYETTDVQVVDNCISAIEGLVIWTPELP